MVSVEELDFDLHLSDLKKNKLLTGDPKIDAPRHRNAEYLHSLSVWDALRDVHLSAVSMGPLLKPVGASTYMVQGIARRSKFIWLSLRTLLDLVDPKRDQPLAHDDVETVAQNLNSIYINIRGALDNFAWCCVELYCDETAKRLVLASPASVSFFNIRFWAQAGLPEFAELARSSKSWGDELKSRRDPSAHRIPLSVVPSIIDDSTRALYDRLSAEWFSASREAMALANAGQLADQSFREADEAFAKLQKVGKFQPLFGHDTTGELMKIYPTVPQDIGQLVKVSRSAISLISKKLEREA